MAPRDLVSLAILRAASLLHTHFPLFESLPQIMAALVALVLLVIL